MRKFNIAGPCDPERHYVVPAEARLPEARALIDEGSYFVLHAPRQTGKTTTLRALARALTAEGKFAALHFSCEAAEPAGDDYGGAERIVLKAIRRWGETELPPDLRPPAPITADHMDEAKERLILARATHLDSLVARLMEPRVRRVMEPAVAGTLAGGDTYDDDVQYVRDLGLIAAGSPTRVANPIYREVIVRVLASGVEQRLPLEPQRFVLADGRLDLRLLLEEFASFWREHGDVLQAGIGYHEVAPQLVLMAFLQRIANGGGYIDREYGVGRGRIDLCVRWPYRTPGGGGRAWQREALELKVWAPGKKDPLAKGLEQLDGYLDRLGLDTGVLVLFDRRAEAAPLDERTRLEEARSPKGRAVTVLRA
jgi:hypothetical protein